MQGLAQGVDLPGLDKMLAQFTGGGDPFSGGERA
jgi:hypothetical protein